MKYKVLILMLLFFSTSSNSATEMEASRTLGMLLLAAHLDKNCEYLKSSEKDTIDNFISNMRVNMLNFTTEQRITIIEEEVVIMARREPYSECSDKGNRFVRNIYSVVVNPN